jgi:hypothetical protein
MTLAALLGRLEAVTGSGEEFLAKCPGHDDHRQSLSVTEKSGKLLVHCFAGCSAEAIVAALGLALADLFAESRAGADPSEPSRSPRRPRGPSGTIAATYAYRDEAGELLYEAVRFDPKDFRPRVPTGHGGWAWTLKDVRRVIYRLPGVRQATRS